mmetsp:Transcript_5384/g.11109  ORF Transcript_5384/g.11109 Transcript_5384/m.11109 type:complete len:355 (+) Transcript_5384:823-1887(+)
MAVQHFAQGGKSSLRKTQQRLQHFGRTGLCRPRSFRGRGRRSPGIRPHQTQSPKTSRKANDFGREGRLLGRRHAPARDHVRTDQLFRPSRWKLRSLPNGQRRGLHRVRTICQGHVLSGTYQRLRHLQRSSRHRQQRRGISQRMGPPGPSPRGSQCHLRHRLRPSPPHHQHGQGHRRGHLRSLRRSGRLRGPQSPPGQTRLSGQIQHHRRDGPALFRGAHHRHSGIRKRQRCHRLRKTQNHLLQRQEEARGGQGPDLSQGIHHRHHDRGTPRRHQGLRGQTQDQRGDDPKRPGLSLFRTRKEGHESDQRRMHRGCHRPVVSGLRSRSRMGQHRGQTHTQRQRHLHRLRRCRPGEI